jgi:hypothetical protein
MLRRHWPPAAAHGAGQRAANCGCEGVDAPDVLGVRRTLEGAVVLTGGGMYDDGGGAGVGGSGAEGTCGGSSSGGTCVPLIPTPWLLLLLLLVMLFLGPGLKEERLRIFRRIAG